MRRGPTIQQRRMTSSEHGSVPEVIIIPRGDDETDDGMEAVDFPATNTSASLEVFDGLDLLMGMGIGAVGG